MPRILLVEDDFDTRYMLSLMLKNEGYEVITAADGECALIVAAEEKPDLIITDVSMPRMNGVEFTRQMKSNQKTAEIPVLAITSYGPATMRNAISAGATDCARKPLEFDDFLMKVKCLLASPGDIQ
ncbi:MAG TPA: response regulator [Blastocatellia bacterium]|nr:response regulator [Blastocatellia bacterium]